MLNIKNLLRLYKTMINNNSENKFFLNKYKNQKKSDSFQNTEEEKEKNILNNKNEKNVNKIVFEKLEIKDQKEHRPLLPKKRLAALYFIYIGVETASKLIKQFTEQEIFKIIVELLNIEEITENDINQITKNFGKVKKDNLKDFKNNKEFARSLLQKTFGIEKGSKVFIKCIEEKEENEKSFSFLNQFKPKVVADIISKESDMVSSIILSMMDSKLVAKVVSLLPKYRTIDILKNISRKTELQPEVLETIKNKIKQKVENLPANAKVENVGKDKLIDILRFSDFEKATKIIDDLERTNPELAEELRENLFTFNDILKIPKKSLSYALTDLDDQEIAYILKGASDELKEKFFVSLTRKRRDIIKEEMNFLGKVKKKDVDEKRKMFVDFLRELEENEDIIINPDDEIYVE